MRLWLKDAERRPDPAPVKTDDRKAVLVGLALWIVASVVVLVGWPDAAPTAIVTCATGIVLGLVGLVYTHRRRDKHDAGGVPADSR
jgi:hypothetical protein